MSRYEIRSSNDNQLYFVLVAANGETIATSEMYETMQGVETGIASVKENANAETVLNLGLRDIRIK
jgi:uncharacterized protein YegP (UPF0339 family)